MLLITAPVYLLLVPHRVAQELIYVLVIEPRTITALPLQSTYHAEFGCAPTGHVVAPLLQFYHGRTAVASLPAFQLSRLNELLRRWVLGTVS